MENVIVLRPEWVLERLPHTQYADGDGNISVYTNDATDAHFIELALDTLKVSYETYDYLNDDNDFVFGFDFRIEDMVENCPIFYKRLNELDLNNKNYKNALKN